MMKRSAIHPLVLGLVVAAGSIGAVVLLLTSRPSGVERAVADALQVSPSEVSCEPYGDFHNCAVEGSQITSCYKADYDERTREFGYHNAHTGYAVPRPPGCEARCGDVIRDLYKVGESTAGCDKVFESR